VRHLIVKALEEVARIIIEDWHKDYPPKTTLLAYDLAPVSTKYNLQKYKSIIQKSPHLKRYTSLIFKHLWNDLKPLLNLINPRIIFKRFAKKQSFEVKYYIIIPDYDQRVFTGTLEEMASLYPVYYPHLFKKFVGWQQKVEGEAIAIFVLYNSRKVRISKKVSHNFDYEVEKHFALTYLEGEIEEALKIFFTRRRFKNINAKVDIIFSKGPDFFKVFEEMLKRLLEFAITTMIETIEKDFDKEYELWNTKLT